MDYIRSENCSHYYEFYKHPDEHAKTLVFVHGLGLDSSFWQKIVLLLKMNYSILTYDLRGHGNSELSNQPATWELFCNDLDRLIRHLSLSNIILVGHGFGANIAFKYASFFKKKVASVIVIAPPIYCPNDYVEHEMNARIKLFEEGKIEIGELMAPRLTLKDENSTWYKRIVKSYKRVPRAFYLEVLKLAVKSMPQEELKNLHVPCLILSGELDPIFPPVLTTFSNTFLSQSTFFIIPNSSNMTFVDQPAYTADWMQYFIERPEPKQTISKAQMNNLNRLLKEINFKRETSDQLQIKFFTKFEVKMNGETVAGNWNLRYAKVLLLHLLFNPSTTREKICQMVFPNVPISQALKNLRVYLNHLQKLLDPGEGLPPCLEIERKTVKLLYTFHCDLLEYCLLLRKAVAEKDPAVKIALCDQLLNLKPAEFLPNMTDEYSQSIRLCAQTNWEATAEWAMKEHKRLGQYDKAVLFLQQLLEDLGEDKENTERLIQEFENETIERALI